MKNVFPSGSGGVYTYYVLRAPQTAGAPCRTINIFDGDQAISAQSL